MPEGSSSLCMCWWDWRINSIELKNKFDVEENLIRHLRRMCSAKYTIVSMTVVLMICYLSVYDTFLYFILDVRLAVN